MTHASLFSGIGGAELAASWMGWKNIFHCEINPFGRKVIEYHFPESKSHEDVTKTDFSEYRGQIDVLTAGFPCQPFSVAGQRKGADDDRYLWPEVVRVIREVRPAWVVGENVAGILTMVQPGTEVEMGCQTSLFGEADRKRVLLRQEYVVETVCRDLEREGYEVQSLVIPACAVGAPHRRDRVWFVARLAADTKRSGRRKIYEEVQSQQPDGQWPDRNGGEQFTSHSDGYRSPSRTAGEEAERSRGRDISQQGEWRDTSKWTDGLHGLQRTVSHTDCVRLEGRNRKGHEGRTPTGQFPEEQGCQGFWETFPTQPPVCCGNDGLSTRLDGITFPRWRAESIKAYGNAWVPQVAYEIFRAIQQSELSKAIFKSGLRAN